MLDVITELVAIVVNETVDSDGVTAVADVDGTSVDVDTVVVAVSWLVDDISVTEEVVEESVEDEVGSPVVVVDGSTVVGC